MLCYAVFAASYSLAFLSLQGSGEFEPRCNICNPKPPQTTKQGDMRCYMFTHKYTCKNIVYHYQKERCKRPLAGSHSLLALLWERPKVQAMANTGKCLCWREGLTMSWSVYPDTECRHFAHHRCLNLAKTADTKPNNLTLGSLPLYC